MQIHQTTFRERKQKEEEAERLNTSTENDFQEGHSSSSLELTELVPDIDSDLDPLPAARLSRISFRNLHGAGPHTGVRPARLPVRISFRGLSKEGRVDRSRTIVPSSAGSQQAGQPRARQGHLERSRTLAALLSQNDGNQGVRVSYVASLQSERSGPEQR